MKFCCTVFMQAVQGWPFLQGCVELQLIKNPVAEILVTVTLSPLNVR